MSSPSPIPITTQQASTDHHPSQPSITIAIPSFRSIATRLSGVSRHAFANSRPWAELVDRTAFSRPSSLSDAAVRVRKNAAYFRVNYLIVLATALAYSLILHPFSLLILVGIVGGWIFYFNRPPSGQPLVVLGRPISDAQLVVGLSVATLFAIMITSVLSILLTAAMVGVAIVCAHGAFRDPEDLFMDDQQPLVPGFGSIFGGGGGAATSSFASGGAGASMMSRV